MLIVCSARCTSIFPTSEKERNAFFRDADAIDEKTDEENQSRNHVDIEIRKTQFAVFGKCVIEGQIVKVTGFEEEEKFEMEDQRVRLMIDESLGNKFASPPGIRSPNPRLLPPSL